MSIHVVEQGECLTAIARRYGFHDHRTIYDHPDNATLRRRRPNPNILHPGDQVFIPEKEERTESRPASAVHMFRVRRTRRVLRIVLEDSCWHRMSNEPYELRIAGATRRGSTDGSGLLEQEIPSTASEAQLVVRQHTFDLHIAALNPVAEDTGDHGISGAQARLMNMGYGISSVTGQINAETESALRQFQRDNGLEANGTLDAPTRAKLVELHGA
jgi:N-acetylmuramoyl-L-alanine amidase